jgi:hypothetical protein
VAGRSDDSRGLIELEPPRARVGAAASPALVADDLHLSTHAIAKPLLAAEFDLEVVDHTPHAGNSPGDALDGS